MSDTYGNYLRVPEHPNVLVQVALSGYMVTNGLIGVTYIGSADELLTAKVCSPAMLTVRATKKGPRVPRLDEDGERYRIESYFVSRGGLPVRRFKLYRYKTKANAVRLPGAISAITRAFEEERALEKEQAQEEQRRQQQQREEQRDAPQTAIEWRDEELNSMIHALNIFDPNIRVRVEEYQRERGERVRFRFSPDDSAKIDALARHFREELTRLVRSACVEDCCPDVTPQRGLRLVVNNYRVFKA
jgi:hypothetical protein